MIVQPQAAPAIFFTGCRWHQRVFLLTALGHEFGSGPETGILGQHLLQAPSFTNVDPERGGGQPKATRELMAVKSGLGQRSADFFYKGKDSKNFRLCRLWFSITQICYFNTK